MEEDDRLLEEHTGAERHITAIFSAIIVVAVLFILGLFVVFIFPIIFAALVIIFAIRTVARWSSDLDEGCGEES